MRLCLGVLSVKPTQADNKNPVIADRIYGGTIRSPVVALQEKAVFCSSCVTVGIYGCTVLAGGKVSGVSAGHDYQSFDEFALCGMGA